MNDNDIDTASKHYRILHVIDSLGVSGGAEQQLAANLRHFSDPRLEHHVAYVHRTAGEDRQSEVDEVAVSVHALSAVDESRIGRFATVRRMLNLVDQLEPDLIHCTLADACLAARIVACLRRRLLLESLVNISHDPVRLQDNPSVRMWKLRAHVVVDRLTMRCVSRFHALSDVVARSWQERVGIPSSKIRTIPRGVDVAQLEGLASQGPSRRELCTQLGISPGSRIILNVGRQEPQKGQRYLLEAMPTILDAIPEAVLLIVGREGNSTGPLQAIVRQLGIGSSVRFLGARPDVPALIRAADVFVYPSLYEGLGVALLEAMALGVPVVASDIEPLSGICEHGRSGLLVEPRKPADLAAGILQTLDDDRVTSQRAGRALQYVAADYGLETNASVLEQMYVDLLLGTQ